MHTGEKSYECEICKKKFISSGEINVHERVHTGKNHMNVKSVKRHLAQMEA